jgi:predicted Na+-dependent transporter
MFIDFREIGSHVLLFFLVFGMSATVDIPRMRKQMRNRSALLIGISLQFFILPFIGFVIVKILDLSAPLGIALLVVTTSPGGSYSNCK